MRRLLPSDSDFFYSGVTEGNFMKLVVGITGASGAIYGYSFVRLLAQLGVETSVILTDMGVKVLEYECGVKVEELKQYAAVYNNNDLFAPPASGSSLNDGMAVIPCSMNTLGCIAGGMGGGLLARAAAVTLKEGRKLVTVVRETPLNVIQLENMCRLARAGACVMPASPGFYNRPAALWQLVDGLLARVLDQFHIDNRYAERWSGGDTR